MPPILCLIDGHALAYRAYFALLRGNPTGFTTGSGEPTAGVFGFTSVLLRILEQESPDYLAVAFDTGRTFRDDLYPAYKGTRAKMPGDLHSQIERMRQLLDAFNIPRLEIDGYEADDVLGSVSRQAAAQGLGVKIYTGDKDLLQLVQDRIVVNLPGKTLSDAKDYFPENVVQYLGVRPDQVVEFKGLVGDNSDNIPGVQGIGDKTASSLLAKYENLEGIYAHLDELAAGVRNKLEAGRDSAFLSRQLATIVTDLKVPLDLEQARVERFNPAEVEEIFRQLEFRSLLPRLQALEGRYGKRPERKGQQLSLFGEAPASSPAEAAGERGAEVVQVEAGPAARIVDTPEALKALVERLNEARVIAFDTETTSTDQMRADLVGISLAVDEDEGYYLPVGHLPELGPQLPLETVLEALRAPLTDPRLPKVGHNLKYDFVVLARYGLRVSPLAFDTMIAEWLTNPNSRNLGLKNLAWVRLNFQMTHIEELIGKGKNQKTMAEAPIGPAAAYAASDAVAVLRLIPILEKELEECKASQLMAEVEMPLVTVLADMEMAGISLDIDFLKRMSAQLNERLLGIETQIYTACGESFNLNSPQQLSEMLFSRLKLPPPNRAAKTASGFYSTSADVLETLRGKHIVVDWVLEYRELSKLKSTYLDALPLQVNPETGRVHTIYSQTGSVTGRIASSEPNLQNIPIRSELGREVRKAFVAQPGTQLLSVDYSQVELRIVAHMSGDEAMLAAFGAEQDIHAATAAAIYGMPILQVSKDMRRRAKGINFGLIYGISAYGLMRYTDLTLAESENFMEKYFQQFPGVKKYLDGSRRQAAEQGYVETLLGRRRYFPGLKNQSNYNIRAREEREAINAPVQGTAADIMKIAMIQVPPALERAGLSGRMLLQVHDELVLEAPEAELRRTAEVVREVMEGAYQLGIPLATEARCGANWGEMEPVK
jgi:DNA polymerase-1